MAGSACHAKSTTGAIAEQNETESDRRLRSSGKASRRRRRRRRVVEPTERRRKGSTRRMDRLELVALLCSIEVLGTSAVAVLETVGAVRKERCRWELIASLTATSLSPRDGVSEVRFMLKLSHKNVISLSMEIVHLHTKEQQIGNRELYDLKKQCFSIEEAAMATSTESAEDNRARAVSSYIKRCTGLKEVLKLG